MKIATILIVEDRSENRDLLATLLRYRGYRVLEAMDAKAGLAVASTAVPDLIITDVVMPEVDGYEFVRQLRAQESSAKIPVIFWTASFGQHENARALAESCGVACILTKPSEPEAVFAAVEQVLSFSPDVAVPPLPVEFDQRHTRLLTDKVFDQVRELEATNERLRASESQYRALFEDNPFPMWILDDQSERFLAVNQAAMRHYGYSREEFRELSLNRITVVETSPASPPPETNSRRHRGKAGDVIEVAVFCQQISFEERRARLELIEDVTERNRTAQKIRKSEDQLRLMGERLRSAREEERTRISRHLHDALGQDLTALRMTSEWMLKRLALISASEAGAAIETRVHSSLKLIDEMIATVQKIATDLRPGVLDYGIGAAIEWFVQEFQSRSEIDCTVVVPDLEETLDPVRATEMYRIFQEAITNVARHSSATKLDVDLRWEEGHLLLRVNDNGRGITAEQLASREAIGLLGMRERASLIGASVSFTGRAEGGTSVCLDVPLG